MSSVSPSAPALDLEPALREVLSDRLAQGDAAYAVDGRVPSFVATPASVDELAAVLGAANERGAAVVPWGGGQHMALGNVPARYDIALRTEKLSRVLEYEAADLTITVESGVTLGRLRALLAEHGQFLPIDPPAGRAGAPDDASIGGVLAAGASGPSRHAYGLPRDWLLGCRIALAEGGIVKGGGRVVKNVAGYDLPKLAVGSLGTLGVIVEATFKVAPLPSAQETFLATYPSLEDAGALLFAADERGLALRALALRSESPNEALAACWLAGAASAVERTARELAELAQGAAIRRLEGEESERWWAQLDKSDVVPDGGAGLRVSLPPSSIVDFIQRLTALCQETDVDVSSISYPTTGLVLEQLGSAPSERLVKVIEATQRQATEAGGSMVVAAAPLAVKERIDVWGDAGDALPLMRRVKEQFDPKGTLNPGRFVGRL